MKSNCLKTLLAAGLVCGGVAYGNDAVEVPAVLPGMAPQAQDVKIEAFSWDMVPETVAVIGDKTISKADLQAIIEAQGPIPADIPADQVMMVLFGQTQMLIQQQLLDDKLVAEGLGTLAEVSKKAVMDEIASLPAEQKAELEKQLADNNVTMDDFIAMVTANPQMQMQAGIIVLGAKYNADKPAVTAEDAKKFYDENPEAFLINPESVEVSHILLQVPEGEDPAATEKRINEIHAEVSADPSKFAEIAKAESSCPSSADGGALGMPMSKQTSNIDPVFLAAALALEAGEISPVVETQFGYHVIMCTKKTAEEKEEYTPEFEEFLIKSLAIDRDMEAGSAIMDEYMQTVEVKNELPQPAFNPMMFMQ